MALKKNKKNACVYFPIKNGLKNEKMKHLKQKEASYPRMVLQELLIIVPKNGQDHYSVGRACSQQQSKEKEKVSGGSLVSPPSIP